MKIWRLMLPLLSLAPGAAGQATVLFGNRVPGAVDARVQFDTGSGLLQPAGSRFVAQLYAAAPGKQLLPVGEPVPFRDESQAAQGYFYPVTRTIPGVEAGKPVQVGIRSWYRPLGETYEQALERWCGGTGVSGIITILATGGGILPPTVMEGLQGFVISGCLGFDFRRYPILSDHLPTTPTFLAELVGDYRGLDIPQDMAIADRIAYVAGGWSGLLTVDIGHPESPTPVGFVEVSGRFSSTVALDAGQAYVGSGPVARWPGPTNAGLLSVFAQSGVSSPRRVGAMELPTAPSRLLCWRERLLVAGGNAGLYTIDLRNPQSPKLGGTVSGTVGASDLALADGFLLVATGSDGLKVVDLEMPPAGQVIAGLDTPKPVRRIALRKGIACLFLAGQDLLIADVTDPRTPRKLASLTFTNVFSDIENFRPAQPVSMSGGYVFLTHFGSLSANQEPVPYLTVVALGNPERPEVVGRITLPRQSNQLLTLGDVLWSTSDLSLASFGIGPELELTANGDLTLAGRIGGHYRLEAMDPADSRGGWNPVTEVTLNAPWQSILRWDSAISRARLYRARRM